MAKKRTILDVPREVRNRYYRYKYRNHGKEFGRRYSRIVLPIKEFRKNRELDRALATFKREAERASKTKNECVKTLMNMGLYYLVAEKDIQCVKIDALTHPDEWRRNLCLRVILLTIHEWNVSKVGTGNLKELFDRSNVSEGSQKELFFALRQLRKSQKEAATLLQSERNSVIAHRDPDALKQINMIESLDVKKVLHAAGLFYDSSSLFLAALPKVLQQAGSVEGLFSYMLRDSNP
mgnify:CR=1 FL=1